MSAPSVSASRAAMHAECRGNVRSFRCAISDLISFSFVENVADIAPPAPPSVTYFASSGMSFSLMRFVSDGIRRPS